MAPLDYYQGGAGRGSQEGLTDVPGVRELCRDRRVECLSSPPRECRVELAETTMQARGAGRWAAALNRALSVRRGFSSPCGPVGTLDGRRIWITLEGSHRRRLPSRVNSLLLPLPRRMRLEMCERTGGGLQGWSTSSLPTFMKVEGNWQCLWGTWKWPQWKRGSFQLLPWQRSFEKPKESSKLHC